MKLLSNQAGLLLAILLMPGIIYAQTSPAINQHVNSMNTTQKNKELVQKLYEEVINQRKMELLPDYIAEDFIGIRGIKGAAGFKEPVEELIKAFPDIQYQIEELIAEEDKVYIRWKLTGTNKGQFQHIAPTGNVIMNEGMAVFELKGNKIIKSQIYTDRLGFLQSLNVLPQDISTLSQPKVYPDKVNFIDKFIIPAAAINPFHERMQINRNFIRQLSGFIEDEAYEYADENGNLMCVTIAAWQNELVLQKAKEAVQAEYKRTGFNPSEFYERYQIQLDRGVYKAVK